MIDIRYMFHSQLKSLSIWIGNQYFNTPSSLACSNLVINFQTPNGNGCLLIIALFLYASKERYSTYIKTIQNTTNLLGCNIL